MLRVASLHAQRKLTCWHVVVSTERTSFGVGFASRIRAQSTRCTLDSACSATTRLWRQTTSPCIHSSRASGPPVPTLQWQPTWRSSSTAALTAAVANWHRSSGWRPSWMRSCDCCLTVPVKFCVRWSDSWARGHRSSKTVMYRECVMEKLSRQLWLICDNPHCNYVYIHSTLFLHYISLLIIITHTEMTILGKL